MKRHAELRGLRSALQPRLLALAVAACFGAGAHANPLGPQVLNGQAGFATQGGTLTVTNSPGTIINWQSFSIGAGETTRFLQQSASSAVLNRITGQDPSQILGSLQSNGRVFLVNPNGILFGPGAQVDVNGLVASTLNISDSDFLAGRMRFDAGAQAGTVGNQGVITTPAGGQVYLIAPDVENSGVIHAPGGQVMLAAGHSVQLVDSADPAVQVVVSAPTDRALNLGSVISEGGRIGIYGALVNQRGTVSANSAVVGADGHIVFKASDTTELEAGSRTSATGAGTGGHIELLGQRVGLSGDASVDASGRSGGGSVLIGGDFQGANPAVMNADKVYLGSGVRVAADALDSGTGGGIVLWSNGTTRAYGALSARGGAQAGNGGRIETSGHALDASGLRVDASAPRGHSGSWLLDPLDITISATGTALLTDVDQFADLSGQPATISSATIAAASADVVLQATNNIDVNDPINMSVPNVGLTMQAGGNIGLNAPITTMGGNVSLTANYDNTGNGGITIGSASGIWTQGGAISLSGAMISLQQGSSGLNGGQISLLADKMSLQAPINSSGNRVTIAPVTAGTAIDLGTVNTDNTAGTLELSNTELSNIAGGSAVAIGNAASSGPITIRAPLMQNFPSLSLLSAGTITQDPGAWLGGGLSLRLEGSSITLGEANPTGVIAARTSSGNLLYHSMNAISVQQVDGLNGVSVPASADATLYSDSNIGQSAPITGGGLLAVGTGYLSLMYPSNQVARFAAVASASSSGGSGISFYNNGSLEIGTVSSSLFGSMSGITADNMSVDIVTAPHTGLTVSQPIIAGLTGSVDLTADTLALNSTVTANDVSIRPHTGGRPITVGSASCHETDPVDGSCLSVTQLWRVIAPTIGIGRDGSDVIAGSPDSGSLTGAIYVEGITNGVSAISDRNVLTTRIGLLSGAGISQGSGTGIDVQDLGAISGGGASVNLTNAANKVVNIAGKSQGGDFAFADSVDLNVATLSNTNAGSLSSSSQSSSSPQLASNIVVAASSVSSPSSSGGYVVSGIDAGGGNVSLATAGAISGGTVSGNNLDLAAGKGIGLATKVASLSAINADNSGASDIGIDNTGVLTLNDVRQAGSAGGGITVSNIGALTLASKHTVSTGSGAIHLDAHSPLTVDGTVTSTSGSIELDAVSSTAGNDILTVNGTVSTGGTVKLEAGTSIVVNGLVSGSSVTREVAGVITSGNTECPPGSTSASCASIEDTTSTIVSTTNTAGIGEDDIVNGAGTGTGSTSSTENDSGSSTAGEQGDNAETKKGDNKDDKKTVVASEKKGAKKDEPAKKMYCN